jgi:hypothetical protein
MLNDLDANAHRSAVVALSGQGNGVAVWESSDSQFIQHWVSGRRFNIDGTFIGGVFQVNLLAGDHYKPDVAMRTDGSFVAVFGCGADGDVCWRAFDPDGVGGGFQRVVNQTTQWSQDDPAVATCDSGENVVVWNSMHQDGESGGVVARLYLQDGTPVTDEFQVNTVWQGGQGGPDVAMAPDCSFVIVWHSENVDPEDRGIAGRRYDANAQPIGDQFLVNSVGSGDCVEPSVAVGSDGRFVVAYDYRPDAASELQNKARWFDSNGMAADDAFFVASHPIGNHRMGSVSTNSSNQVFIVWYQNENGEDGQIYGQRYDAQGIPLGVAPW